MGNGAGTGRSTGRHNAPISISGLISGDKVFYRKSGVDAKAALASRRLPEDGSLSPDTVGMAESFGYKTGLAE